MNQDTKKLMERKELAVRVAIMLNSGQFKEAIRLIQLSDDTNPLVTPGKAWGWFDKDGNPIATGDKWHHWECPNVKTVPCEQQYHDFTGEPLPIEFTKTRCPVSSVATKVDQCATCKNKFIYP